MRGGRGGDASHCYAKEWSSVFSEDRDFKEDGSYVEFKRGIEAVGDDFGIFLQDSESSVPFSRVEEVQEFCRDGRLADLKSGVGLAGQRCDAWLDDRSSARPSGVRTFREYDNPLSPAALYLLLKVPRYGNADIPDANRRLIYIANPNPYYILALAETASFHQVSVLRDAIWKYLALQTSIRVRVPHRGYSIFQLDFHIGYFALRPCPTPKESQETQGRMKAPRQWTDLTFLEIQSPKSKDQTQYGIREAQMSFVVCGPDNRRWVGYAFVDVDPDEEDFPEHSFSYEGHHDDPISLGSGLGANIPIWDPREYFMMIVEVRMALVLTEWECLVRTVERSITQYRSQHSSTLSQPSGKTGDQAQDAKKTFDWTQQTIELLDQLLDVLSKTNKAWEIFNSSNGDIGYFSATESVPESPQCRTHQSLRAINETFEQLDGLRQTLLHLEKSCRQSAEALQLRLTLEGNDSLLHNGFATELTISILAPVTITIAYFSMPQTVIPFKLNSRSFTISIFIIMAAVRVLFFLLCAWPRWTLWWTKITAWFKKWKLEAVAYGRFIPRGAHGFDRTAGGLELQNLDV